MARVLGIGGVFFKCRDRDRLSRWYANNLGIRLSELGGCEFSFDSLPEAAYCVWGPFDAETRYFDPSEKDFMINLIVDDLRGALQRAVAGGATQIADIEEYDYGRFGWFVDPEGNKIELWEPKRS